MRYKIDWKQESKVWEKLARFCRAEKDKYKWLYKVACEIIHDIDGVEIEEINKDLEKLWNLKNKLEGRNKNDN